MAPFSCPYLMFANSIAGQIQEAGSKGRTGSEMQMNVAAKHISCGISFATLLSRQGIADDGFLPDIALARDPRTMETVSPQAGMFWGETVPGEMHVNVSKVDKMIGHL